MKNLNLEKVSIGLALSWGAILILLVGCAQQRPTDMVTVQGSLSSGNGTLSAQRALATPESTDLSSYELYCVTFESQPRSAKSDFASDGHFSLQLPKDVTFGCFVNDASTHAPVATLTVVSSATDLSGNAAASNQLSLKQDLNLGSLTLDLTNAKVEVQDTVVNAAASDTSATTALDIDTIDNQSYTMECLPTGDSVQDAACAQKIVNSNGANTVFMRVLKGEKNGEAVRGLGVWQNQASFQACGGYDIAPDSATSIEAEGYTFDNSVSIGNFNIGAQGCDARQNDSSDDQMHQIQEYLTLEKLERVGNGWMLREEHSFGSGCVSHETLSVYIEGQADLLIGTFQITDITEGCGAQDGIQVDHFNVKFTRQ